MRTNTETELEEITSTTHERSLIVQTPAGFCVIAHHNHSACYVIEREGSDVYFTALVGGPGAWTQTGRQELPPGSRWAEVSIDRKPGWHELKWQTV